MKTPHMRGPNPAAIDFDATPFVAIWETTRACDLACRHCRAEAIPEALPGELSTEEGFRVIDELAEMGTPIVVLSGGDPAKRQDLAQLVRRGKSHGMRMATIPAATPLLTRKLVRDLKEAGLDQLALSLDGPTAEIHDTFRGTPGAFDHTLRGAQLAREEGLPLQINTAFSAYNMDTFDAMAELVRELGVVFWEVFFLVPMGRGKELAQMNAKEYEKHFAKLEEFSKTVDFIVKVTEAPHYRRYLMERAAERASKRPTVDEVGRDLPHSMTRNLGPGGSIGLAPKGVNSGNGHVFVNYKGDIQPSGFLPLICGNVREQSLAEVYREHEAFRELRDVTLLKGKCGICGFRSVCGGSRARAYAMTGDYLAVEPFCDYVPAKGELDEMKARST